MSALLISVFTASVLGSLHCLGMCGPLVAVYSCGSRQPGGARAAHREGDIFSRSTVGHFAYHAGRATTYTFLGALAGVVGAALDLAGEGLGVARVGATAAGVLLVLWGLVMAFPQLRGKRGNGGRVARGLVQLRRKPPVARAALLGLLTPVLPCGWLYAFAVTAAGTGDPWTGALVMFTFWLGTLPALLGLGALIAHLSGVLRQRAHRVAGVALVLVGLFSIVGRVRMPAAFATPGDASTVGATSEAEGPAFEHERPSCH